MPLGQQPAAGPRRGSWSCPSPGAAVEGRGVSDARPSNLGRRTTVKLDKVDWGWLVLLLLGLAVLTALVLTSCRAPEPEFP